MNSVFNPKPRVSAPIDGTDEEFPVERIFCVGRNYAAHVAEMGMDPEREAPFFFTKWAESYVPSGSEISYPMSTESYHYEIELVVAVGKQCANVPLESAKDCIYGYATGLDMTRRDLQLAARERGRPWDTGKNFEESAPMGRIHKAEDVGHISAGRIWLEVNGEVTQDSNISNLIWSVDEIIADLSRYYTLMPGDLIFTGTPDKVGPTVAGDKLVGYVEGLSSLALSIRERNEVEVLK